QLESSLLNEPKLFISTGLGGKNNLLRFFIVLFSFNESLFSSSQQKLLTNEFEIAVKNAKGEIETIEFEDNTVKASLLMPLTVDIVAGIHDIIDECNIYGGFLNQKCLITNIKKFSKEEIMEFYYEKNKEDRNYKMEI
ncbi:MAG: hypothetical protein ABIJ97_08990, partial [Bacteroidota bacterium]